MPIQQQIIKLIDDHYDTIVEFHENNKINCSDYITDVCSGKICKEILENCPDNTIPLPMVINTDGVKIFNVGNNSSWPVLMYQNGLPPSLRFLMENILVIALFNGPSSEMDIHNIMQPICEELIEFSAGFHHKKYPDILFKPMVTHASLDLPAKYKLMCFKQFNSSYACTFCTQKRSPITGPLCLI